MRLLAWALALSCGLAAANTALAQGAGPGGYPNRPVKIIVPFAPAGPTDVAARLIAGKMSENLKQQFYIENQAGANGTMILTGRFGYPPGPAPCACAVLAVASPHERASAQENAPARNLIPISLENRSRAAFSGGARL